MSYVSILSIMEPDIDSPFSDLPIEIFLTICKDAAQPTFSQREKYDIKNPYSTALSLCLVSRLVRRIILPDFLHTILLRRHHSLKKFANALLMQKAYAEKESDLFFDYTSAIQRMWMSNAFDYFVYAEPRPPSNNRFTFYKRLCSKMNELGRNSVQDAWSSRTDINVGGHASFAGKTKNLTIIRRGDDLDTWTGRIPDVFSNEIKESVFLASIPHLTHLIDLAEESNTFRGISHGVHSPGDSLFFWMKDTTWACMKSLETLSVVYPHLPPLHDLKSISYAAYATRGIDLHVERLTVSAALYKQDPDSFPWGPPWFPVTDPGNKRIQSDGVSFEVTRDKTYFSQYFCSWDKAWACGLTDG
ncbi:uncharacterized protein F5891DRAFT_674714 [Suillus fuscotomentosus]|uniref:Uncharacterized protein n=1 Tax=Suillus fuscotomentosus TaxID=1912939 RepID=A0AAD4HF42_9AGAM|nr:uncharacterized protein F5891DRAFT_674714 [Suillus fuscotomentosus]KAG1895320.1 hypothetical protein F5891DRAFT_674714 [Suillus fuscotomentosus]